MNAAPARWLIGFGVALGAFGGLAQTTDAARDLKAERAALEQSRVEGLKDCYQRFNVAGCQNEVRDRYIVENQKLREAERLQHAQDRASAQEQSRRAALERAERTRAREEEAARAQTDAQSRAQRQKEKRDRHAQEARP